MEPTDRPQWLRLSDIVTAATILVGALSAASYAFALGYIFAIEPRFLPAFGFGDLLLLFASSTSTAIFSAIVLIPSLGMLFTGPLFKSFEQTISAAAGIGKVEEPAAQEPRLGTMTPRHWAAFAVSMSVTLALSIIAIQDMFSDDPYFFSMMPELLVVFGTTTILLSTSRARLVREAMPFILSLYALAAFYVVGHVSGRRDLVGSATSRQMPCAFLDAKPDCFDVLLLGSEAVVLRKSGRVGLVSRDRVRLVQSREAVLLAPAPKPKKPN